MPNQNQFKAFVLYFKENNVSWLIRTKYIEKKFKLQLLYLKIDSMSTSIVNLKISCHEELSVSFKARLVMESFVHNEHEHERA